MASKIDWTDAVGVASLSNGLPVPLDRLASWNPKAKPIGPAERAVGTGSLFTFTFRTDYTASFEIRNIPNSSMALMLRLQEHLLKGGQVSLTTGDSLSSVYPTCELAPDTEPTITPSDSRELRFVFAVTLLNVAATPVRMICQYG